MNKRLKLKPTNILATAPSPSKNQRHLHRNFPTTAIRTLISFLVLTCTTPLSLGYKGGGPGGITTVTTTLSSPQASTSAAKYKALDNTVSYADVSNLQKTAPSVQEEQQEQEQQTTSKNDKDHSSTTHTQIIHLPRKENDQHGQKMMMDGGEYTEEDQKFLDRVRASVRTVQNWDADVELLKQCREVIPWDDLRNNTTTTGSSSGGGPYSSEHDRLLVDNPNALFLQRLARWFPTFMSWVNAPPCRVCGSTACEMKTVRGPITDEEKEGEAKRVEVYYCPQCKENTTTFPRYNKASKLLDTRKGRCGEYSNLFGLFCRSVGFETRLVLDLSDHLWTEIRLTSGCDEAWVMADACEGIIDKASMYEHGWGKDSLCYMIGIGSDHVVDVTPRYTRQYLTDDFQNRRRQHTSSEEMSQQLLKRVNLEIQQNRTVAKTAVSKARAEELQRRSKLEIAELQNCKQRTEWTEQEKYGRGRISGSMQWRQARGEVQKSEIATIVYATRQQVAGFEVEAFVPAPLPSNEKVVFRLHPNPTSRHGGIQVSAAPCSIGEANSVSVVVVDEQCMGSILQSKSFVTWPEVSEFLDTLPSNRIVLMNGQIEIGNETKPEDFYKEVSMCRLGGWDGVNVAEKGVLYIGQIDAHPDWAFCTTILDGKAAEGHEVELPSSAPSAHYRLRTEHATVPHRVAGRLPDAFLPLNRQLQANDDEKRRAFLTFVEKAKPSRYSGYTTKTGSPVYLLNSTSYPLQSMDATTIETIGKGNVWNTFLSLPSPLVPEGDNGVVQSPGTRRPIIDVPLEINFFNASLGPTLLSQDGTRLPTQDALVNARLIGLYFSAHWCMPCRQFTPMLAEMYDHLRDEYPNNGMEIVFVSGDRDQNSFDRYFATMPWKAIAFDHLQLVKQSFNMTYGVRGIPSFVVLDAVSGRVVVPASQSRQEVAIACRGGEQRIEGLLESWLERVPPETQELLSMLELSIAEDSKKEKNDVNDYPYLRRPISEIAGESNGGTSTDQQDMAAQIKVHFERLLKSGHDPNSAAATALNLVAGRSNGEPSLDPGPFSGKATYTGRPRLEDPVDLALVQALEWNSASSVSEVLSTAQKYLKNVGKEPWEPRFRSIKLSNKVADSVSRVEGGWGLLQAFGFEVAGTSQDFKASIPVGTDVEVMDQRISQMMKDLKEM